MNLKVFLKEAKNVTLRAGEFILRNAGKIKKVEFKGNRNVVTWVDRRSEELIKDYLEEKFPGIPFLAEELNYDRTYKDLCWVVDPLDGTNNFSHGYPVYCVSCALVRGKKSLVGVVYDPTRDELFWAGRGGGAFLNRKRIRVSRKKELRDALLCTGFYYDFEKKEDTNLEHFINFTHAAQGVRRSGAAAIDLCYVASSRLDGFWELHLKPWDTAAGSLILEESGGKVTKFNGEKFDMFFPQVLASNRIIHNQMLKVLSLHKKVYKRGK